MERRIGEQFKYEGVTLEVAESPNGKPCGDCYFLLNENKCFESGSKTGKCSETYREDERSVYFKEVKNENRK